MGSRSNGRAHRAIVADGILPPPVDGTRLLRNQPVLDALQQIVAETTGRDSWTSYDHLRFIGQVRITRFASISSHGLADVCRA